MIMLHYRFTPRMSNTNAQFWSSFCNSYPTVSKNCCMSKRQVLFICELGGLLCLSVSTTLVWMLLNVDPLVHISLWQKSSVLAWQSIVIGSLPLFIPSYTRKCTISCSLPWCEPVLEKLSLCHAHSAQVDDNWTALTACPCLTLNYSVIRPQQCWQSYGKKYSNIVDIFVVDIFFPFVGVNIYAWKNLISHIMAAQWLFNMF
jgi:hypothetical protein